MVSRGSLLIAASFLGLAAAASAGVNRWTSLGPPGLLGPPPVGSIAVAPDAIYAATAFGVYRGTLDGGHWENVLPSLLGGADLVAVAPSDSDVVYAAGGARLQRSDNGGESWRTFLTPGLVNSNLAVDPSDPLTIWVGTQDFFFRGEIYRSRNGGASWTRVLDDLDGFARAVAIAPTDPDVVYVGSAAEIRRTRDGGASWESFEAFPRGIGELAVDPLNPLRLFASEYSDGICGVCFARGVWRTEDGGETWSKLSSFPGYVAGQPIVDPASTVYVPTSDGVFVSRDHGETWQNVEPLSTLGARSLALDPADPSRLFAGTFEGVYGIQLDADGPCAYPGTILCLHGSRFEVTVTRHTSPEGPDIPAQAVPVTRESGYFWFFDPENVEIVVKVLDGRFANGHFWVFFGALSNVGYTVTVRDTETGETKSYENPQGTLASVADTQAFPAVDFPAPRSLDPASEARAPTAPALAAACEADFDTLCLNGGRFRVEASFQPSPTGPSLRAPAAPLTDDTGYFWFFHSQNIELVVKVLDGRGTNGHFWVFSGALSNVAYTITVTDTETDEVWTYSNPWGELTSIADTAAF